MTTYHCLMVADLHHAQPGDRTPIYNAMDRAGWSKIPKDEAGVSTVWTYSFEEADKFPSEERSVRRK